MKKKYEKPEIVFEKLAFKSALATCGFISTTRISDDEYPCEMVDSEGDYQWPGGKGEPTMAADDPGWVLINDDFSVCNTGWYCYHVPEVMMEGSNDKYIGLS